MTNFPSEPPHGSLARFGAVADAIGGTNAKLTKVRLLADYLRDLDDDRLAVAARWFTGRVFPAWDARVLQIGGAALSRVLQEVAGVDADRLRAVWSRHADIGDSTFELLSGAGRSGEGIDLLQLQEGFEAITRAGKPKERAALLVDLLGRCNPVEGKYLTKLIASELRIGLREGLVEDAIVLAFGRDPGAVRRADMVTGDLGEVALRARRDDLSSASPTLFAPLRCMLASPVADAEEVVRRLGDEVWIEDKYDGIRCQLHRDGSRVVLYSRDLKDVTEQFPEVAQAAASISAAVALDGELLAIRDGAVLPFQSLQARLGRKRPDAEVLAAAPVVMVCWDLLMEDGDSLLDLTLRKRRERLEQLQLPAGFVLAHHESARGAVEIEERFLDARRRLNEGLLAKDPDSPYLPGRRGLFWLKLKKPLDTLDVVVTGAEFGHGRRRSVLSDVTFAVRVDDTDHLVPVGKAYTGLTDVEISEMTRLLEDLTIEHHGRYRSVRPEVVLEVAFDRIQPSARHRSGFAMRFPRIVRWRHDKGPADIDLLSRVASIAEAGHGVAEPRVDAATGDATATPPSATGSHREA